MTDARGKRVAARMAELRADAETDRILVDFFTDAERAVQHAVDNPGVALVDGEVVYGEDGKPVADAEFRRLAQAALTDIRFTLAALRSP
ncbi:MAG TPA: hypothetical protein VNF47_01315 [Streptosporangiaceae bacterium]|nr:hypothetical protein [Streptosporangiaceae bacterium]